MKTKKLLLVAFGAGLVLMSTVKLGAAAKDSPSVEAVESAYKNLNDLTAKFVQTTKIALVDKTVTRKGLFQFKKGGKLRIEYESPDRKVYLSDGTTLWVFIPGDDASLQTFAVNDESVPKEALSFMNGFGKLSKEFSVSESSAFSGKKEGETSLHLIPKGKTKHYESLDALFGLNHLIEELIITNNSGNVSHYTFSGTKIDAHLADRIFTLSSGKAAPDTLPK